MAELYIPQLRDKIRITAPLVFTMIETNNAYENNPNLHTVCTIADPERAWDYKTAQAIKDCTLIEGTVLEFRRYFVSASAKTNDIEVGIFAHPDRRLMSKKQGGSGVLLKLVLPTHVLNRVEYEVLEI